MPFLGGSSSPISKARNDFGPRTETGRDSRRWRRRGRSARASLSGAQAGRLPSRGLEMVSHRPWYGRTMPARHCGAGARERAIGLSGTRGTTYARARIGKCHLAPVSATPARKDLGPRCKPGPGTSSGYVDLTCFRNGAYRVKCVPGPQVNDPAKKPPEVAVMATFSNGLTANWGCAEAIQSLIS